MTGRPHIFLDIETRPAPLDSPAWRRYVAATEAELGPIVLPPDLHFPPMPPRNYGPDAAAKWTAERLPEYEAKVAAYPVTEAARRATELEEARQRTGLDAMLGEVCVVCWAIDDGEVATLDARDGEAQMLAELLDRLEQAHGAVFVGHNIGAFDAPFLQTRAYRYGLRRLVYHFGRPGAKPWDRPLIDTLDLWPQVGHRGTPAVKVRRGANGASLPSLCAALGVALGHHDIDGSQVGTAWERGEHDAVIEHCRADIDRLRQVYHRIAG